MMILPGNKMSAFTKRLEGAHLSPLCCEDTVTRQVGVNYNKSSRLYGTVLMAGNR